MIRDKRSEEQDEQMGRERQWRDRMRYGWKQSHGGGESGGKGRMRDKGELKE